MGFWGQVILKKVAGIKIMKIKRFTTLCFAVLSMLFVCMGLYSCNSLQKHIQPLNYVESIAKINNPDQGFYRPIAVKVSEDGVAYNKNIISPSTQLYHLRIDISEFSQAVNGEKDKQLTQVALDGLGDLLALLKSNSKNAVVRFAYDPYYGGSKDKEPSLQVILKHIEQVCVVLNSYPNTITAIEAGLIGPWGEMHSSAIANAANITPIIEALLSNTQSIPILVRTPKMIYDYLGISLNDIDNYSIDSSKKEYRLGLYNDGYLGSDNDLGTYTDRQREVKFLSRQTGHLPYGGEVVIPSSSLHNIENCLPEMNTLHLSYLNIEWNNEVITKWKNSLYTANCGMDKIYYGLPAFTYIENRLGYRFVLTNSVFKYSTKSDNLQIELDIKNVGFGNLNRAKYAQLIFADKDGTTVLTENVKNFDGANNFNCSAKLNLQSGQYDVFLRIYGEEYNGDYLYCVQFANENMWNENIKANKIGSIAI